MWTCPRCGAKLVQRNMSHACGPYTVEGFLDGKGPRARALFDGFVALVAACGPYETAPAKTRVAFMTDVRFGGVERVSERGMTIWLGLPRMLDNPRVYRVEEPLRGWFVHHLRVFPEDELDAELAAWVCESHEMMGRRKRLAR